MGTDAGAGSSGPVGAVALGVPSGGVGWRRGLSRPPEAPQANLWGQAAWVQSPLITLVPLGPPIPPLLDVGVCLSPIPLPPPPALRTEFLWVE